MPTYEYICEKCGHTFEKYQSIVDQALTICPEDVCTRTKWGKGRVKRKIGAGAGLLFKGSGFYITDYRSEGYKQAAKQESTATTAGASPSSADSKTAAAPAAPAAPAKAEPKAAKPKGAKD